MDARSTVIGLALLPATAACAGDFFSPIALQYLNNNGVSDATGANLAGSVTYDIAVHNITGRDLSAIVGFDFGAQSPDSPPLDGIPINGTIFNHYHGTDTVPDDSLLPAFPALRYDSYWSLGDQPVEFEPGSVDLDAKDSLLNGRFMFHGAPVNLAAGEFLRVGRVTFLEGNFDYERPFGFDAILEDGSRVRFGVPAPGASATLGIATLCPSRRRRA
jgi:hypothetical protein